jgi:hypothetical protein
MTLSSEAKESRTLYLSGPGQVLVRVCYAPCRGPKLPQTRRWLSDSLLELTLSS